ncbi:Unknown protein sequence [Pseudomonas amygdali pv. lachrymans]|uniref:Uncharacterized protein n=1 Tax=Pseudomonas amygdali pv. lachrymans TaxID=53707 RepID=A0ABR5KS53_PSEAV|nr:Unknown protein sequence [Pseudomonas amygdali pv. lachrymans]
MATIENRFRVASCVQALEQATERKIARHLFETRQLPQISDGGIGNINFMKIRIYELPNWHVTYCWKMILRLE